MLSPPAGAVVETVTTAVARGAAATVGDPSPVRWLVVLPDEPGAGLVAQEPRQRLAVELLQNGQDVVHAFCFSLQLMQTRVHGIARSRASAIGSPQSRHTP